jgi:hypothetical protein
MIRILHGMGIRLATRMGLTVTGNQAVIKDCMDQCHAGSIFTTSGAKRSVRQARDKHNSRPLVKGRWMASGV